MSWLVFAALIVLWFLGTVLYTQNLDLFSVILMAALIAVISVMYYGKNKKVKL